MSNLNSDKKPSHIKALIVEASSHYTKKQKIVFIATSIIVILAVLTSILIISTFSKAPTENNLTSKTYTAVTDAVTIGKTPPSSVIIAPANKEWWAKLQAFSYEKKLSDLEFSTISKNASSIAYTISSGAQYKDVNALGIPTMFVVYKDSESAAAAGRIVGVNYSHFVRGNLLLFIPTGAYTDVDYSLTQYDKAKETIDSDDLTLNNKAMWQINVSEFNKILSRDKKEDVDITTYAETLKKMGITKDTGWVGYSSDGLNWNGKVTGLDSSAAESPSKIEAYLASQIGYLKNDGTTVYGKAPSPSEQSGIIINRQNRVLTCCMIISDNEETVGSLLDSSTSKFIKGKILSKDEGIFQVQAYSNTWFALMIGQDTAHPVSGFDKVTFTIKDTAGNSTISLEPLAPQN